MPRIPRDTGSEFVWKNSGFPAAVGPAQCSDDILRSVGSVAASMDVLGILEIVDGKIVAWREYADPGAVGRAMGMQEFLDKSDIAAPPKATDHE
jgi:Limonene-1,2-epoxide hydrolase catalytic domain